MLDVAKGISASRPHLAAKLRRATREKLGRVARGASIPRTDCITANAVELLNSSSRSSWTADSAPGRLACSAAAWQSIRAQKAARNRARSKIVLQALARSRAAPLCVWSLLRKQPTHRVGGSIGCAISSESWRSSGIPLRSSVQRVGRPETAPITLAALL